ncbi:unnamed protein product [Mesocestoides corti]|uniref:XPG_I_2 domain-containing protein n=1 Tax=Mesocestoides corti TaxID=53468 RepID=A0A0R3UKS3_MESCO|nr:unnamed protein product [Mesocestoides corti]
MLISNEIWAFIEQENSALRPFQLHNTTIVVNALDFMLSIIRTKTDLSHGGDYSLMEEKFDAVLNNYFLCNIKPIFVFGGVISCAVNTLTRRLLGFQKRLGDLDHLLQEIREGEKSCSVKFSSFPVFAKEALMATLSRLEVAHVTCDSEAVPACVALAARLRCPVVADSGEFLLYEFEEQIDSCACFSYVPLRLLSSRPVPQPTQSGSFCLLGRVFNPSTSGIHRVPYPLRPFLALYLEFPFEVRFPLPAFVAELENGHQNVDSLNPAQFTVKRIKTLITWLESTASPLNALRDCVERLNGEEMKNAFIHRLISITSVLTIDFDQGGRLLSYLFPNTILRDPEFTTSADLTTWLSNEQNIPELLRPVVGLFKTESTSPTCQISTFFSQIPPTLLRSYRSGIVSPVMLSRLFSSIWILYAFVENLARDSVTDCARGLRYLQYCLLSGLVRRYGVELWNGCDEATVSEISRTTVPSNVCKFTFRVKPFYPSSRSPREDCASFIFQNLGYQLQIGDDWIQSLALSLTVWHAHTRSGERFDLLRQPTALAIALIACVMEVSNGRLNSRHLEELADSMVCEYNIDVVHDLNQFQLVYLSLVSLFRLLDVIVECTNGDENESSTLLPFMHASRVLPHCRLAHNLAITLSYSGVQKEVCSWLRKLLSPLDDVESTKKADRYMMQLVVAVYKMTNVHQVMFESHAESLPFPDHCGKKQPPTNRHGFGKKAPQRQLSHSRNSSRAEIGRDQQSLSHFPQTERGKTKSFGSPNNNQFTLRHDYKSRSRSDFISASAVPKKFNRRNNNPVSRDENLFNYNQPGGVHPTTEHGGYRKPYYTRPLVCNPGNRCDGAQEISELLTNSSTRSQFDFNNVANQQAQLSDSTTPKNPFISDIGTGHEVHDFHSLNEDYRFGEERKTVCHSSASVVNAQSFSSPPPYFSSGQKYSGRRFSESRGQTQTQTSAQNQLPVSKYDRYLGGPGYLKVPYTKVDNGGFYGENTKNWTGVRKHNPPQHHGRDPQNELRPPRNVGCGQTYRFESSRNKPQNNRFGVRGGYNMKPRSVGTSEINQTRFPNKPSGASGAEEWSAEAITDAVNKLAISFQ